MMRIFVVMSRICDVHGMYLRHGLVTKQSAIVSPLPRTTDEPPPHPTGLIDLCAEKYKHSSLAG